MTAKDIMRRRVWSASPEMTLQELAQMLTDRRISGAPVVDPSGRLVGVVSQTDFVRFRREHGGDEAPAFFREPDRDLPHGYHVERPEDTRVAEIMTPVVISASEDATLSALARLMIRRRIHRVVITRGDRLLGLVTSTDLLRVCAGLWARGGAEAAVSRRNP